MFSKVETVTDAVPIECPICGTTGSSGATCPGCGNGITPKDDLTDTNVRVVMLAIAPHKIISKTQKNWIKFIVLGRVLYYRRWFISVRRL
jgi:hypothetical protein